MTRKKPHKSTSMKLTKKRKAVEGKVDERERRPHNHEGDASVVAPVKRQRHLVRMAAHEVEDRAGKQAQERAHKKDAKHDPGRRIVRQTAHVPHAPRVLPAHGPNL